MARKKIIYCVLDTETATLPIAAKWHENERKKIAIAKPLVYDIGWTITDRKGNILQKRNYLVQETFFVPQIFNTAYYKDKRPQYIEMYNNGTITALNWNQIVNILLDDLTSFDVSAVAAYNAAFDFKRAIPFTERYIKNLYSDKFQQWEERQNELCEQIVRGEIKPENDKYLESVFIIRGQEFLIIDLWGMACEKLLNTNKYRDYCLENNFLTASGEYFKTSAETTFSYLTQDIDFVESHTALSDAEIETHILQKIAARGKMIPEIPAFCFRQLGTTWEYVKRKKQYRDTVIDKMSEYLMDGKESQYAKKIERIVRMLERM